LLLHAFKATYDHVLARAACECLLLAQSGRSGCRAGCLLSRVKQT
jgi:hypothetical protein